MNEETSKNIIITLLSVLVFGLLSIIYIQTNQNTTAENSTGQAETEAISDTDLEASASTPPNTKTPSTENGVNTESSPISSGTNPTPTNVGLNTNPTPTSFEQSLVIVTYTESGFIPPVVEVRAGNSVTFVNSSSKPLWVTSEFHPTAKAQFYPGFDQGRSISKGGTYTFNFTQIGVWGYKNLNQEQHLGAISVISQQ